MIRKIHKAKEAGNRPLEVWGTGKPSREFLYAADAAEGILLAAEKYSRPEPVNLGTGSSITIKDLVHLISELMGYKGEIVWNKSRPDGQMKRQLDTSRARKAFGFRARTTLRQGLETTIEWYLAQSS